MGWRGGKATAMPQSPFLAAPDLQGPRETFPLAEGDREADDLEHAG